MAYARSQSFDNLLTITSTNNAELSSAVWKPRSGTGDSVESLESGYDTVDGRQYPAGRVELRIPNGGNVKKRKKLNPKTVCSDLFKEKCAIKVFVIILFFVIVICIPLIWHFYNVQELEVDLGRKIRFYEKQRLIAVNRDGIPLLSGHMGKNIPAFELPHDCAKGDNSEICLRWYGDALLRINYVEYDEVLCYNIEWRAEQAGTELKDCFDLSGSSWYGGPLLRNQKWPIDIETYQTQPYVSGSHWDNDVFGSVIERHWVSSKGVGISLNADNPLFISSNSTYEQLCFHSHYFNSPYRNDLDLKPVLNYTLCSSPNATSMTQFFITNHTPIPQSLPDIKLMATPVWTPADDQVNETGLVSMATTIKQNKLPGVLLELDLYKMWEVHNGDLDLNLTLFPSGVNLTSKLKSVGFDLALGVHPFANVDSAAFRVGVDENYFVFDSGGDVPGFTKWWGGTGTALDMSNEKAVSWFVQRLKAMKLAYGVDRFTFYGGQTSWLPHQPTFSQRFSNPDNYARFYVEMASKLGNTSQVQVGSQTQDFPVFLRLEDQQSSWEGLRSLIPTLLTLSAHGYTFVNPGIIGGRDPDGNLPDKELYIRWLQLATFLPVMQFSVPPWSYGSDVISLAQTLTQLHQTYTSPKMTKLAFHCLSTGDPIIRPLWWVDPYDSRTMNVGDQFMIGNDLLIAPIVTKGATSRDIVLPFGLWREGNTNDEYMGSRTIKAHPVPLDKIVYFERV